MTRRLIFRLLAAATLDPERLLWKPGAKLISIPARERFLKERYLDSAARAIAAKIDARMACLPAIARQYAPSPFKSAPSRIWTLREVAEDDDMYAVLTAFTELPVAP